MPDTSPDDPAAIAHSLGIDPSLIVANGKPQFSPVSSGGGVTVLAPTGNAQTPTKATGLPANPVDDPQAVAHSLGIDPSLIVAKPALPADMQTPPPANIHATPDIQAAAAPIAQHRGFVDSMLEGMWGAGPLVDAATAATGAALQPMLDPNAPQTFGDRFARNLAIQREAQRQYDAAHPLTSIAGNLVGGAMLLGPLAGTTPGAVMLGLPNATRIGSTVGGRIYSGLAGGAAIGGTDAALRGDNPVTGAEVGGAIGAAGPVIGQGAGALTEAVSNALSAPTSGPLANVGGIARNWLAGTLANETDASIAAARARMGPQGFLADINPAATELAAGIANRAEPPASAAVGEAYRTRQAAQPAIIEKALSDAFGGKVNIEQFKGMIAENRAAAADPLYAQWRSMQVQPTPELKALIPRLESTGAFDEARYLSAAKGISLNQQFASNIPGVKQEFPTPATWDLVKRGLDSKIEQALSAGSKTRAAALLQLKNELITEVGKTPAGQVWNQARREFADRSELLDQIAAGQDTFLGSRSGLSVDQMREELRSLSGPELAARVVGARNAADEVMGAARNGDTTLRNKFLAPNNQEKLRLLLGDKRADALIRTMEQQDYLAGQAKYVNPRGGSPTAPRTAAINALEAPPRAPWNPKITEPLSFIPPAWVDALRPSTILQGGRQAAYASARRQIVPALLARGNAIADLVNAIRTEGANRGRSAAQASMARARVTGFITGPASETGRQRGGFSTNALVSPAR